MLLSLTIENWMSYRDEATFSLVSSLERQHGETLAKLPGFRSKKALPTAAIYGGNASGKTGIIRALFCLKHMVTTDPGVDGLVPLDPFLLENTSALKPTTFDITFLAGKTIYRYVVEATIDGVKYESLETLTDKDSHDVFIRDITHNDIYEFSSDFFTSSDHVGYVSKSTRANQLFLQSAVALNVIELNEAHDWFDTTLEIVGVGLEAWTYATCVTKGNSFLDYASNALSRFDTGIVGLSGEPIELGMLPKSASLNKAIANLKEDERLAVIGETRDDGRGLEMMVVAKNGSSPEAQRFRTVHVGPGGEKHSFAIAMESSGTQRLISLLPMFCDLVNFDGASGEKVFVVDELDRCLHTMLTKRLIENFTACCSAKTRKQLLFTTHDLLLMDQSLMRRDEMYISQRGSDGCSELVSLAEFDGIRFDKDLIRSYLDGRFGGVPMLGQAICRG